ncbi:thioredoxin family protein [Kribbella jiaozuonensis]|uniref:Thiol reductase thioredoxin n=1 Tax=Kribbella jiaozuonensis TaxID=2575441 RepID=A0A4V5UWK1_9ACTN|nr:thioredoxin domain-containing protein [Kribbella jiaozuonensis]TKK76083.1 thiol reductase thioredoxin [Kribbella jiaozuonensis]
MTAAAQRVTCPKCQRCNDVPPAGKGAPRCAGCRLPLPWVVDAGDGDFGQLADTATVPVLVDLWVPWCSPWRFVNSVLERLAIEKAGELKLVKVNAGEAPAVSRRFDTQANSTLILLSGGQVVGRHAGAAPAAVLRHWLEDALTG